MAQLELLLPSPAWDLCWPSFGFLFHVCVSVCLSFYLSFCCSVCLSVCLSLSLSLFCLSICLSLADPWPWCCEFFHVFFFRTGTTPCCGGAPVTLRTSRTWSCPGRRSGHQMSSSRTRECWTGWLSGRKAHPHQRRIAIRPELSGHTFQWQFLYSIRDEFPFVSGVDGR